MGEHEDTPAMQAAERLIEAIMPGVGYTREHIERCAKIIEEEMYPETPRVLILLEGGNVHSVHSNLSGLDIGILDLDEEEDFNRRIKAGESEEDALNEVVHEEMKRSRSDLDAGKLPHQAY